MTASDSDGLTRKPSSSGTNTSSTSDTTIICGCANELCNEQSSLANLPTEFNCALYPLQNTEDLFHVYTYCKSWATKTIKKNNKLINLNVVEMQFSVIRHKADVDL